jgi:hypothetical protein
VRIRVRSLFDRRWVPAIILTVAFVHNTATSWRKWGNIVIDVGRELDLPRQMVDGKALYSDLRFYYGPLAPFVNAGLYRIFGVHLDVLIGAGLVTAALMCWLIYRLARLFVDRAMATVVAVGFLYICAFVHLTINPSFNFVLPYTYSATYGMLTASGSLFFLLRHARKASALHFVLSLSMLVLTAFTKLEALLPTLAAHTIWILGSLWTRRIRIRNVLICYLATVAVVTAGYSVLALHVGTALLRESLFSLVNDKSWDYLIWVFGFRRLKFSILLLLISAATLLFVIFSAHRLGKRVHDPSLRRDEQLRAKLFCGGGSFGFFILFPPFLPFRILPIVLIGLFFCLIWMWFVDHERRNEIIELGMLFAFSSACLLRIVLQTWAAHYGFYLLPVCLVTYSVLWSKNMKPFPLIGNLFNEGVWLAGFAAFLGISLNHYIYSLDCYRLHNAVLETQKGKLILIDRQPGAKGPAADDENLFAGSRFIETISRLSRMPPETRLLVVPQGAGIIFFSGLTAADGMFSYLPMEISGPQQDEALRDRWAAEPPDLVVWMAWEMPEFRSRGFGKDYAVRSARWIEENYEPFLEIGPPGALRILRGRGFDTSPMTIDGTRSEN